MLIKTKLNNYRFFYPYLYYFVAKYLADHLSQKQKEISHVIENLHKDENAYITIFISHHTKNYNLLDEIILNAMMLFENYTEATLSKTELNFFDIEIENVAKAALPKHTSPEIERRRKLEIQEQQEQQAASGETSKEEMDDDAFSTSLRRSIRTVEVMGIIIKNRIGSLEKQKLEEILTEAINVNLRILTSFFTLIKDEQEQQEIVRFISSQLKEIEKGKQNISMEKLEREAKKYFGI
jgi:hypothetical protein